MKAINIRINIGDTDLRKIPRVLLVHAQSFLTLYSPTDGRPPSSSVHGIFQARTLEWGATSYSKESSQSRD